MRMNGGEFASQRRAGGELILILNVKHTVICIKMDYTAMMMMISMPSSARDGWIAIEP